ncbi:hypothetical protein [Corynebacterium kalidii]
MTSPLTRNEQNSKSRAQTFGIRPDLFQAAQDHMVKKSDLDELSENLANAGVRGFTAATLPQNIHLGSPDSGTADYAILPFTDRYGPAVAAHPEPPSLQIEESGLWTVTLNLGTAGHGLAPAGSGFFEVSIYVGPEQPAGGPVRQYDFFNWRVELDHQQSFATTFTVDFVVESPGDFIYVQVSGMRGRAIEGDYTRTRLSVRKTDNRTR